MMGLFYLLAIYGLIRSGTSSRPRFWAAVTAVAAMLSLGSKEVAVSVPIVILLYDRTFLAGSFREAWLRRWGMYLGLIAAWGMFAVLQFGSPARVWAGYGLSVSWFAYARSQPGVILHYLRLAFWPHPLVFDYGWRVARTAGEILPGLTVVGGLFLATLWALRRRRAWGFLGAWFFLILAPTSSVMPIVDLAFEHRMYLPLAAVVGAVVLAAYEGFSYVAAKCRLPVATAPTLLGCLAIGLASGMTLATRHRNATYQNAVALWEDTVAKAPQNHRAHNNLGSVLTKAGRTSEAVEQLQEALRLNRRNATNFANAQCNWGLALFNSGHKAEAIEHYQEALRADPNHASTHNNLGVALLESGHADEAAEHFQAALRIEPNFAGAKHNLGLASLKSGRTAEAVECVQESLRLNPRNAEAHLLLGNALAQSGHTAEAVEHFHQALKIDPACAGAHAAWGVILLKSGRTAEAVEHFRQAVRLNPNCVEAQEALGTTLLGSGRSVEAIDPLQQTLRLKPDDAEVHLKLGLALFAFGRSAEAIQQYQAALKVQPKHAITHNNLGNVLLKSGRTAEAADHYRQAIRLRPDYAEAHDGLGRALLLSGHKAEAVEYLQRALQLAQAAGNGPLADAVRKELQANPADRPP
jgi:tetratricopeptide (TPR) repeat protein